MLLSSYSFSSLCLMAALALIIMLLLRLVDSKLKLIRVIPSPLKAWEHLCGRFVKKLNRKDRSANALRLRSRVLTLSLITAAFFIGILTTNLLNIVDNDYLDIIILALLFFIAPSTALTQTSDKAAKHRYQIETDAISLLQRITAPLLAWLILSWAGVFISLTFAFLSLHSASASPHFAKTITRLSKIIFVPAATILCLILTAAAFFTSKGKPLPGLRAGLENIMEPHKAVTLNIAEALGVSLAGPKGNYLGLISREWLGAGTARLQRGDVKRWRWLEIITYGLLIALLLALSL